MLNMILPLAVAIFAVPGVNAFPKDARDGLPNTAVTGVNASPKDAEPPANEVKAAWKSYDYSGPQYRGYDCAYAEQALRDFLGSVEARELRSACHWRYGLSASWQALSPIKENPRLNVEKFLAQASRAAWLSGLSQSWTALAPPDKDDKPVIAVWLKGGFQQYMSGAGRICNIYADVTDYLLNELPLKNVSYFISCNSGSGVLNISFEYLAPSPSSRRTSL